MAHTRIKICGITRPEDALLCAELGADAIGLNFFAGPRKLTPAAASDVLAAVPPMVFVVGLLGPGAQVAATPGSLEHEDELATYRSCDCFQICQGRRLAQDPNSVYLQVPCKHYWSVCHIGSRDSLTHLSGQLVREHNVTLELIPALEALVLDTAVKGQLGGTGQTFNWHWIAEARAAGELQRLPPVILAGGLNPENVAEAIGIARPYGVDVSSGVEIPGKPGVKDPAKLRDFIQAVRGARTIADGEIRS